MPAHPPQPPPPQPKAKPKAVTTTSQSIRTRFIVIPSAGGVTRHDLQGQARTDEAVPEVTQTTSDRALGLLDRAVDDEVTVSVLDRQVGEGDAAELGQRDRAYRARADRDDAAEREGDNGLELRVRERVRALDAAVEDVDVGRWHAEVEAQLAVAALGDLDLDLRVDRDLGDDRAAELERRHHVADGQHDRIAARIDERRHFHRDLDRVVELADLAVRAVLEVDRLVHALGGPHAR